MYTEIPSGRNGFRSLGALFPYLNDDATAGADTQRPAALKGAPQIQVFVESLFETRNPTHYDNRPRWIIDQGNTDVAFRMGGFWGVGVVVYLLVSFGMLIALRRRAGIIASIAGIGLLGFVAVLPQSNELRYYMFIPLTWAATIGMLYPQLRDRFPRVGLGLLVLVLALFGHMVSENWTHYQQREGRLSGCRDRVGRRELVAQVRAGTDILRRGHAPDRDHDDRTHDARVLDRGSKQGVALSARQHRGDQ